MPGQTAASRMPPVMSCSRRCSPDNPGRMGDRVSGSYRFSAPAGSVSGDAYLPVVQQLLYTRFMSVGFRPTEEDLRVIEANRREDEKTSDVIRRALRLLDREAWEERARADMHRLRTEDLSAGADAWEYDADGNIRIIGANLTVPARSQDRP
jgi:hypothetical protein